MSALQAIVPEQRDQILQDSIEQKRHVVLTHNTAKGWRVFKSSFLSGSASSGAIHLKMPVLRDGSVPPLPEPGAALGVTFRLGHKKCMFGSVLESRVDSEGDGIVSLRWPDHLQQLKRRAYDRVQPPRDAIVPVRFWRQENGATISLETRDVRHGQLEDMSAGGMRVKVANAGDLDLGGTYRCVFTPRPGKPVFILDALARHREAREQGRASVGFQFVGLEATSEGRHLLERLARTVSQFQRAVSRGRHGR